MLSEKINRLKSMIFNNQLAWSRQSGVPFILFAINESEQLYLQPKLEEIQQDGKTQGYQVLIVNIEQLLYQLLLKDENGDLTEMYKFEKDDYKEFMEEMQNTMLKLLYEWILKKAEQIGTNGRIIFTRVGSTAPHFRFIQLLSKLENKVLIPLCFFVPGTVSSTRFIMLDDVDISGSRAFYL
ncbi:BREX protein BrxB domain-containing protein [Bacillus atrophaeus]